jgi:hypothetical protein
MIVPAWIAHTTDVVEGTPEKEPEGGPTVK